MNVDMTPIVATWLRKQLEPVVPTDVTVHELPLEAYDRRYFRGKPRRPSLRCYGQYVKMSDFDTASRELMVRSFAAAIKSVDRRFVIKPGSFDVLIEALSDPAYTTVAWKAYGIMVKASWLRKSGLRETQVEKYERVTGEKLH